jgi:hypothetical protein
MASLLVLSRLIDRINEFFGRNVAWLVLAAVLISAGNAISRKAFDLSSNAWLELQWYLYGTVFMLAAAYTLQRNEHVRIDIVTSQFLKNVTRLDRPSRPHFLPSALLFDHGLSRLAVHAERVQFRRDIESMPAGWCCGRPSPCMFLGFRAAHGPGVFGNHQAHRGHPRRDRRSDRKT